MDAAILFRPVAGEVAPHIKGRKEEEPGPVQPIGTIKRLPV
jgi:hypothetical protein